MFSGKSNCGSSGFLGGQWVYDDPPGLPFDNTHVGEIEATQLVYALRDLIKPVIIIQCGLTPQAGVNGIRGIALYKIIGGHIPDNGILGTHYLKRCWHSDETSACILEVRLVAEIQLLLDSSVSEDRGIGSWRIALRAYCGVCGLLSLTC